MNKINHLTPSILTLVLAIILSCSYSLSAEGTKEVAPNSSIVIDGNNTHDIAALHINRPEYNNFASYTNPDPKSRLNIRIIDPSQECIYFGLSYAHLNANNGNPPGRTFEYRIKDPSGNVVYGPFTLDSADANIRNWTEGSTGPMQLNGAAGYNAIQVSSADLMSQGWSTEGDFYIEFQDNQGQAILIDYWDFTVVNCSGATPQEKKGRVWSFNWAFFAINDFGFPVRPFNGAFYVCAPDPDNVDAAFVTQIDFNNSGFRPAAFNVAFNSFGSMNTGNITEDRKSVEGENSTQSEYAIFLNDPIEFCETAVSGDIDLLGVTRCNADEYCLKFASSKVGLINLFLDFDGQDGMYTPGTADLFISSVVTPEQVGVPTCIDWDGLDGLGNPLDESASTQIPIVIGYAQGIYHFPIYDAEFMDNGFRINAIRPSGDTPLLFYDDSNISVASGSGEPAVQLSGCTVPCHSWNVFIAAGTPGFGNLNTINSWWFSQLIIKDEVFVLPAYFECAIEGPSSVCDVDTATLSWNGTVVPEGADAPTFLSALWTGPGIIGDATGASISANVAGNYVIDALWITNLGDTCGATCNFDLLIDPSSGSAIDTLIGYGDTLVVNGEEYTEAGEYQQVLVSANGCDSILIISLAIPETVVNYDFNDCTSYISQQTNIDYSEFEPTYPSPLDCADVSAGILHREEPTMNPHSCTPGLNGTLAMCVGSLDDCNYDAGNVKSVIFEITLTPTGDQLAGITELLFNEKAPTTFEWIDGGTGPNNYPTLYGLRVLKDNVEIFNEVDIPTTTDWSEEVFDFIGNDEFSTDVAATYTFELLGYCLVGNGASVNAWDLDDISVRAACTNPVPDGAPFAGSIFTTRGEMMSGVEVQMAQSPLFGDYQATTTNEFGEYFFENALFAVNHYIKGYKNDDVTEGLSTIDLLLLQKHILGLQPFKSPYQYIAGDVNNDNKLSALDIIAIRKVLLGLDEEFSNNESWRFGNHQNEISITEPWDFGDVIEIINFQEEYLFGDFVGVKIGDVSNEAAGVNHNHEILVRADNTLHLNIQDAEIKTGETLILDVTSENVIDIKGLQFALTGEGLSILNLIPGALDIEAANYALYGETIKLSWGNIQANQISANEVLFSIEVSATESGRVSDMLVLNQDAMPAEVYTGDQLQTNDVSMMFSGKSSQLPTISGLKVSPNPFTQQTALSFELQEEGKVALRFYDISGRLLYMIHETMPKGVNEVVVSDANLKQSIGVIICRVESDNFVAVQRLVHLGE